MAQASPSQFYPTTPPPKTRLAEIYSHPTGEDHVAIRHNQPYKSGLTPTTISPNSTPEEVLARTRLENYQKRRFHGFTAEQLEKCEAFTFSAPNVPDSKFDQIPIHPILEKWKWQTELPKHLAPFPLGLGRDGFWTVDNPVVWEALVPALRLATLMLNNCHTWPWWDAFLAGEEHYTNVIDFEIPAEVQDRKLFRFRNRNPAISSRERQATMDKLNKLGKEIEFKISCGNNSTTTGYLLKKSRWLGLTAEPSTYRKTVCNISIEIMEPLLSPRTCVVEKFLAREQVAGTLLHEITHALWYNSLSPDKSFRDPYYEDEVIAETGASMENAMFGGLHNGFNYTGAAEGLGYAGKFRNEFNTLRNTYTTEMITLEDKPPGWDISTFYPVPTQHYSNMNNPTFWEVFIKRNGQEATHMGPRTYGSRCDKGLDLMNTVVVNFPDGDFSQDIVVKDTMTDEEKEGVNFENDRRAQMRKIGTAMDVFRLRPDPEDLQSSSTSSMELDDNYEEPVFYPRSTRHEEIRQFFFTNWAALALDSLDFEIPEHLLFSYVVRAGLSDLTPTEWRAFLLRCEELEDLFSLRETNCAPAATHCFVTMIDEGWPEHLTSQQTQIVALNSLKDLPSLTLFLETLETARDYYQVFEGRDFDKDILRRTINLILREKNVNKHFSGQEFDNVINDTIATGQVCTTAPAGIVRRISTGDSDDGSDKSDSSGVLPPPGIRNGDQSDSSESSGDYMDIDSISSDDFDLQGNEIG